MFSTGRINIYDENNEPSLFKSPEYRKIVDVITSHKLMKTVDVEEDFCYLVTCATCGVMPHGADQDFHVAHMLLIAGIGDKVDVLRQSAQEVRDRGDIGAKRDGVEIDVFLDGRADIIENPKILWE